MAYHYDEKLGKYVYDNKPTEVEKTDNTPKESRGNPNPNPHPNPSRNLMTSKHDQYSSFKGAAEKKFGRLWWLWAAIGIGIISKVLKYVGRLLDS